MSDRCDATTLPSPRRCVYCSDPVRYSRLPFVPTCERHADLPALDAFYAFRARRVPTLSDELRAAMNGTR